MSKILCCKDLLVLLSYLRKALKYEHLGDCIEKFIAGYWANCFSCCMCLLRSGDAASGATYLPILY